MRTFLKYFCVLTLPFWCVPWFIISIVLMLVNDCMNSETGREICEAVDEFFNYFSKAKKGNK